MKFAIMAFTFANLLLSVCQNLTDRNPTQMPYGEKFRAYDAINDTLKDWFRLAGPIYTTNQTSKQIYPPANINVNVIANSNQFTLAALITLPGVPANAGGSTVSMASTSGIVSGMTVQGVGIQGNTTVTTITPNVSIGLSLPTVTPADGVTSHSLGFIPQPGLGYANLASCVPQAIVIAGDGQVLNRVMSVSSDGYTGTLWRNYLGATGPAQATLYTDMAAMLETDFQVVTPPVFTGPSSYPQTWPLIQWTEGSPWMDSYIPETPWLYYGRPIYYMTLPFLPLNGTGAPYWTMRLWPLPGYIGNISYTLKSMPPVFGDQDLNTQRKVPVPDQYKALIATLCQRKMMGSALWNPKVDKQAILREIANAERDLNFRVGSQSTDAAPRPFGTPKNF